MIPAIDLRLGVDEHHRAAAAALYYDAFSQLLAPILGERSQALPLLSSGLDLGRAVAAIELGDAGDDARRDHADADADADAHAHADADAHAHADAHENILVDRQSDDPDSPDTRRSDERRSQPVDHGDSVPENERLVGICGLHFDGRHFVALRPGSMLRAYGLFDGLRRILVGGLLDRQPRPGELVIDGIAVLPAARGRGIGALLLGELERFARAQDLRALSLDVAADNTGAVDLYRRCGFIERGSSSSWLVRRAFGILEVQSMRKDLAELDVRGQSRKRA